MEHEVAGEDYDLSKKMDRHDWEEEFIDGQTGDLIIIVMQRIGLTWSESVDRIKKYLK